MSAGIDWLLNQNIDTALVEHVWHIDDNTPQDGCEHCEEMTND